MNKTENLKSMYEALKAGLEVNCNGCHIFRAESRHKSRNGRYPQLFFWHYYGSSAIKVSMSNLRWLCSVIAESNDYSFTIVKD